MLHATCRVVSGCRLGYNWVKACVEGLWNLVAVHSTPCPEIRAFGCLVMDFNRSRVLGWGQGRAPTFWFPPMSFSGLLDLHQCTLDAHEVHCLY